MFLRITTFLCFMIALNCFLTSATGRLYDFWVGRRGSGKLFAVITSVTIRLTFAFVGLIFLTLAAYLKWR
jgi:hypothetical protein